MKEESEKVGLELNIQKTEIMASGPIISWQIDGETVETVSDFILGGSKITADGDCHLEIKRSLEEKRKINLFYIKISTKLGSVVIFIIVYTIKDSFSIICPFISLVVYA